MEEKKLSVKATETEEKFVDGAEVKDEDMAEVNGGMNKYELVNTSPPNDLKVVDTNTIESLDVLKDAASAAIYGTREGNGVILVT